MGSGSGLSNGTTLVTTAILGLPIVEAVKLPGMREFVQSGQEALDAGAMIGHQVLPDLSRMTCEQPTVSSRSCSTHCSRDLCFRTQRRRCCRKGPPQRSRRAGRIRMVRVWRLVSLPD